MPRIVLAFTLALSLLALPALSQDSRRTPGNPSVPEGAPRSRAGNAVGTDRPVSRVLVGEHAPDFGLTAAGGEMHRLKDWRGNWTALFFVNRIEDLDHVAALAATLDTLHVTTVVVCNEKVGALTRWQTAAHAPLSALADERGDISALYGLWDRERSAVRHGLFLLDAQGVVRAALLGQPMAAPSLRAFVQVATEGF